MASMVWDDIDKTQDVWVDAQSRPAAGTEVRINGEIGTLFFSGSWNKIKGSDAKANGWIDGKVKIRANDQSKLKERKTGPKCFHGNEDSQPEEKRQVRTPIKKNNNKLCSSDKSEADTPGGPKEEESSDGEDCNNSHLKRAEEKEQERGTRGTKEYTRADYIGEERDGSAYLVGTVTVKDDTRRVYESDKGKLYYLNESGNKGYCSKGSNKFKDVNFFRYLDAEEKPSIIDPDGYLKADANCFIKKTMVELRNGTQILTPPLVLTSFGGNETTDQYNTDLHCIKGANLSQHAKAKNNITMDIINHTIKNAKDHKRDDLFAKDEVYKDFEFLNFIGFRQSNIYDPENDYYGPGQGNEGATPGNEWKELYSLAQRTAPVCLFFFSHRSVASKNCQLEINNYIKMRKNAKDAKTNLQYRGMIVALHKEGSREPEFARQSVMYNQILDLKNHEDGYFDTYFEHHSGATNPTNDQEKKRLIKELIKMKENGELVAHLTPREYTKEVIRILEGFGY